MDSLRRRAAIPGQPIPGGHGNECHYNVAACGRRSGYGENDVDAESHMLREAAGESPNGAIQSHQGARAQQFEEWR